MRLSKDGSVFFGWPLLRVLLSAGFLAAALLSPNLSRGSAAQCGPGTCPDYCGTLECSCGEFNCGSYEFCTITGPSDFCTYPGSGCAPGEQASNGCCASFSSPILIDLAGDGFALTNVAGGALFPIGPTNVRYRVAWTEESSDDAWLVLDRNGNGTIDNGEELFGNYTPQPAPPPGQARNGYLALAVFDDVSEGGNRDGRITAADAIYSSLRLWRDVNHNGISEPGELSTLSAQGLTAIDLDYRLSHRKDEFGNLFRYRSKAFFAKRSGRDEWRWTVDVFVHATRIPTT
jgi:hypothetical protein